MKKHLIILMMLLVTSACSTSTYIKLPENSQLKIKRDIEQTYTQGNITRTPFSWSSAGGVPYEIEKDGNVIQKGRLRAKFRPESIFWPPFAILYWPIGFRHNCYDLTGDVAIECSMATRNDLVTRVK